MTITISTVESTDRSFSDTVEELIDATAAKLGYPFDAVRRFELQATDTKGGLAGGLVAYAIQGWLFIRLLGVAERARGGGIGRALLAKAEDHARESGLVGVYLDTFEFQAPRFYRELGYTECGRLPAVGAAPQRVWFAKAFEATEARDRLRD